MRFERAGLLVLAAGLCLVPRLTVAETIAERVDSLEQQVEERKAAAERGIGIDFNVLVDTTYNYSFNRPPDGDIQLRIFTPNDDSFDLRDAVLVLSREREDESWGFKIAMDFGRTAVAGNGTDWGSDDDDDRVFDLREAFLTYDLPITVPTSDAPIELVGGKFVTLLGWEVLLDPSTGSYNDNITMSLLSGFSIPFTHLGLLGNFPINDMLNVTLGVINGWDNVVDNNSGKSLIGGIGIAPLEELEFYIAGTFGPEQNSTKDGGPFDVGAGSNTGIVTANAFWQATDMFSFVLDGTFANASDLLFHRDGQSGRRSANWWGVSGYWITSIRDSMQFTVRAEVFNDSDGVKTMGRLDSDPSDPTDPCTISPSQCDGQTLWEITPTFSWWLNEHILWRVEYRHDESSKKFFFSGGDILRRGQDTFSTEILVTL